MAGMFSHAKSFNRDISKWDVSNVLMMDNMFFNAASFRQKLCGSAWVRSKASKNEMFVGSFGSILRKLCRSATTQSKRRYVPRQPITKRELIVRTSVSMPFITFSTTAKTLACQTCGTFYKSGRASCCAPGGAWFKSCGGVSNKNVDHRWSEGVKACKRKFEAHQ